MYSAGTVAFSSRALQGNEGSYGSEAFPPDAFVIVDVLNDESP